MMFSKNIYFNDQPIRGKRDIYLTGHNKQRVTHSK